MPPATRSSSPSLGAPRTCTLRTRFTAYPDLERAVALLVGQDGRVFVPLDPASVAAGESLKVAFTTLDGAAAVNRLAVVDSTAPDASVSGGHPGVVLRLLAWKSPPPPETAPAPEEFFERSRHPLAGIDTNMVALLVECSLTESQQEVGRSYDDIPCVELPAPEESRGDEDEPTRRAPTTAKLPPLEIAWESGEHPAPRRWRPGAAPLLIGAAVGMAAAAVLALGPTWGRALFGHRVVAGLSRSIAALDSASQPPVSPALLLAAAPPPVVAPAPEPAPAEEPPAAAGTCQVRLVSQPAPVEVWLGDRRLGRTPSDHLAVPCGAELIFRRPRYQPVAARAATQPGAQVQELSVHLVRPAARLQVTSAPEGAEVRLHGRIVGHTPATLTVSRYETIALEVRAAHFKSWKRRLYVRDAAGAVRAELAPGSGRPRRASPSQERGR
jgi:hypothetical protein